jgi:hypothetical protein
MKIPCQQLSPSIKRTINISKEVYETSPVSEASVPLCYINIYLEMSGFITGEAVSSMEETSLEALPWARITGH